jgi:D-threo-aldose 1-dehydrogenase
LALELPSFGMGCSGLGNLYRPVSDQEAQATIVEAVRAGVRYFDTAPLYGFGLSERRVGAALPETLPPGLIISTKVGRVLHPARAIHTREGFVDALPFEPVFDYSFDGVMRSFESSLARLRRSRVNILLAHDLGEQTHGGDSARMTREFLQGGYEAMRQLRASGRVDAIGLGVNETSICEELLDEVPLDVILLAGRYTLLEQGALPLLDRCARLGVAVIVGGPFNSGLLVEAPTTAAVHYNYGIAPAAVLETVRKLRLVCERFNTALPAAALRFPAGHPAVRCVLAGLSAVRELEQALAWLNQPIGQELWLALRETGLLQRAAPLPT